MIVISSYRVQNIVASADLKTKLNLGDLVSKIPGAQYDPKTFPGLILRLEKPKTATLLFHSGKVVCTGSKTLEELECAIETVVQLVNDTGIPIDSIPTCEVQNIVASADLGQPVNLVSVVLSLGLENVEYEPEVFPGLVYRMFDPKCVILLFSSGRLVCTGAKESQQIEESIEKISKDLQSVGLL